MHVKPVQYLWQNVSRAPVQLLVQVAYWDSLLTILINANPAQLTFQIVFTVQIISHAQLVYPGSFWSMVNAKLVHSYSQTVIPVLMPSLALLVFKDISSILQPITSVYVNPHFTMSVTYALTIQIVWMHINKMERFCALSAILCSFMCLIQSEDVNVKNLTNK